MPTSFPGGVGDWLDFMPDTVTIDAWTGQSVSGVPAYAGAPASYLAHIELKNHMIVDHGGREIMARGRVFLGTVAVPSVKDKLTLPSEYVPTTPPILAVNTVTDEAGNHHVTLEIG